MMDLSVTQQEVGQRLIPDATRPGSTVSQVVNGTKSRIGGLLLRLLEELGAEEIQIKWKK